MDLKLSNTDMNAMLATPGSTTSAMNMNMGVGAGLSRKDAKEELETLRVRIVHQDYWGSQKYRDPLGRRPLDLSGYAQVPPQVEAQYLAILDESKRNAAVADANRGSDAEKLWKSKWRREKK